MVQPSAISRACRRSDALIRYNWRNLAEKPPLRNLSFVHHEADLRGNHRWAMTRGEESLKLARRHAQREAERALIPAPRLATRVPIDPLVVGLLAAAAVVWMTYRRRRW